MEFNPDGTSQKIFAKGLRNAVGLAVNPKTDTVWVTVNGRDWLGDDLPPETIYDLGQGGVDGGWPYCYGDRVFDSEFAKSADPKLGPDRCKKRDRTESTDAGALGAAGLAFYENTMFPPEYRNNIFVAFHGSWNRSVPTGYKVVRVKLDDKSQPVGGAQDFITGWLAPEKQRKATGWAGQ